MSILVIETGLDYTIQNVRRFAPDLTWHGQKNGAAVWSAGNCLIVARAVTESQSEIEQVFFRKVGADDAARAAWAELSERLQRADIAHPCRDLERIARKTLATMKVNDGQIARYKKDPEQYRVAFAAELRATWELPGLPPVTENGLRLVWRKHVYGLARQSRELKKTNQERADVAHKTPQQAAAEFFETLASAALPDAAALPTSGAGDGRGEPGEKREPAKPALPPEDFGKARLPSYNLAMAKQIADAIPLAWQAKEQDPDCETKYNNQTIAKKAGTAGETVSRYLGVFRDYGITNIQGIALPKAGKRKPRKRKPRQ